MIQRDASLFADLAVARVAFYEVGQPLRPNVLVDITDVAAAKYDAIAAHSSQTEIRDYVSFARGLNVYRAMTLAPSVRFAEAYWVTSLPSLRTTPFSALRSAMGAPPPLAVTAETKPISGPDQKLRDAAERRFALACDVRRRSDLEHLLLEPDIEWLARSGELREDTLHIRGFEVDHHQVALRRHAGVDG